MNSWTCTCGKLVRGAKRRFHHQRACDPYLDTLKHPANPNRILAIKRAMLAAAAQLRLAADTIEREANALTP